MVSPIEATTFQPSYYSMSAVSRTSRSGTLTVMSHHVFAKKNGWRRDRVGSSPSTRLAASVHPADYDHFNLLPPNVNNFSVDAVVDSGAQVCLWSRAECKARGFSDTDLIPVSVKLVAANKSPISLAGTVILRPSGKTPDGCKISHPTVVYVSDEIDGFFLSLEAMLGYSPFQISGCGWCLQSR